MNSFPVCLTYAFHRLQGRAPWGHELHLCLHHGLVGSLCLFLRAWAWPHLPCVGAVFCVVGEWESNRIRTGVSRGMGAIGGKKKGRGRACTPTVSTHAGTRGRSTPGNKGLTTGTVWSGVWAWACGVAGRVGAQGFAARWRSARGSRTVTSSSFNVPCKCLFHPLAVLFGHAYKEVRKVLGFLWVFCAWQIEAAADWLGRPRRSSSTSSHRGLRMFARRRCMHLKRRQVKAWKGPREWESGQAAGGKGV